jgi:siroheme synthase-like protein
VSEAARDTEEARACMVALHPAGLRVLAVGGGAVAARKLAPYLVGGARVRVIAPSVDAELASAVRAAGGTVELRAYADGDVADAQLVFAATADGTVNARVAADAEALHRLANVADASAPSAFSSAAALERGALLVGVYAGGVPDAARRVRDAIGERLGAGYDEALARLRRARRAALASGDRERWNRARRELVGADFCERVESGTFAERADAWR